MSLTLETLGLLALGFAIAYVVGYAVIDRGNG